jgi:hypothetical protein
MNAKFGKILIYIMLLRLGRIFEKCYNSVVKKKFWSSCSIDSKVFKRTALRGSGKGIVKMAEHPSLQCLCVMWKN